MIRPEKDIYFMNIAKTVATRATCKRKSVGAVIVNDGIILTTGYNGSPKGMPHCIDEGCIMKTLGGRDSCVRTIHAEMNAIIQASRHGIKIDGSTLYCTASCCYDCAKSVINAGIKRVVIGEEYISRYEDNVTNINLLFKEAKIDLYLLCF